MHTTSTNKQFLTAVFAETARGNGRLFVEALAEDVEWRIIGTTSWSKTFVGKPTVLKELLGPLNRQFAGGNTIIAHASCAKVTTSSSKHEDETEQKRGSRTRTSTAG
jgi:ketosteroid isomerase-like protein